MARAIDRVTVLLLFILGCVHNFIAAPMFHDRLDAPLLWFLTGGITLWFAAAINFWRLRAGNDHVAQWTILSCNLALLAFVLLFACVEGSYARADSLLLIAIVAWLSARSVPRRA
ncbi:MAG: hypothetical protein AAFW97_03340 [Pseudomonadota bacterium]